MSSPALATQPLVREAVYLHEIAQLSDADIARATGVARSTARAWLAHTRSPTGERAERLIELSALVERLARVMEPSYIAIWLRKPVPANAAAIALSMVWPDRRHHLPAVVDLNAFDHRPLQSEQVRP